MLVHLEKSLLFFGHPALPVSILDVRTCMGVACLHSRLATYGEWDSRIEGGCSLRLSLVVPDGLAVRAAGGLSGTASAAQPGLVDGLLRRLMRPRSLFWYGPVGAHWRWRALPTEPDPDLSARNS